MKTAVLLFLLLAVPAAGSSMSEVDRFVVERMRKHLVPGIALVIVRDGKVVHRRGFGSLSPDQRVIIGSLSKAITAAVVMQLVDEGRIDLDTPAVQYLEGLTFDDPAAASISVRHLLNQTSGIPTKARRAPGRDAGLAEHAAALAAVRLAGSPGETHIYSSPNYQLLGRIVETVEREPFGSVVQRRLFDQLAMSSSGIDPAATPPVTGHNLWWGMAGPSFYRFEPGRLPTASLISTADDLSRFALSQLGSGRQILSPSALAAMHEGVAPAGGFSYAMGWRVGTTAGVPSLWHGGAVANYRGAMVLLPESRSAVIVLSNVSTMFADHTREIAAGVVALLENRPAPDGFTPLRRIYLFIAAASLLVIGLQLRSFLRALNRKGSAPTRSTILLFDLALPLAIVALLPLLMKISWRGMLDATPDLVVTGIVMLVIGLATAMLKWRRLRAPLE
jgi:CubicO group peptidase (beta-lactamase class C family)